MIQLQWTGFRRRRRLGVALHFLPRVRFVELVGINDFRGRDAIEFGERRVVVIERLEPVRLGLSHFHA